MPRRIHGKHLCVSLALLLLVWSGQAFAAEPVGWISVTSGSASIASDGQERPAQPKMPVAAEDTLKTGQDGIMQVIFRDDTLLSISEGSELMVRDAFTPEGEGEFNLSLLKGTARLIASNVASAHSEHFKVETPLGTIGIRGTEFGTLVADDHETVLLYTGGPILVSAKAADESSQAKAELCAKLAKSQMKTETAYASCKARMRAGDASKMKRQLGKIKELQAQYSCAP